MSKIAIACTFLIVSGVVAQAVEAPHLGQKISEKDAAAWDISIGPDGVGLPDGKGTPKEGELVYQEKCLACHGEKGGGGAAGKLVGGMGTLAAPTMPVKTIGSYWPYATTAFDFIRRSMPWPQPKSLSSNETYAVVAYLLHLNGIVPENAVMNKTTLPKVRMPNRDNFIPLYPEKH